MVKHKLFNINIDKEEAWINQIISQGYRLKQVKSSTGRYKFEEAGSTKPQDFLPNVRIDFRTFKNQEDFTDYLSLFEDCGRRHISGTKSSGTQYFEKIRPDCGDEIFPITVRKRNATKRLQMYGWKSSLAILPC